MKARIMFYVALVALLGFVGNSFGMEEAEEPLDAVEEAFDTDIPEEYDEMVGPEGWEGPSNTYYGQFAGGKTTGAWNTFIGATAGAENLGGHRNTFIGAVAGNNNTTGFQNTFVGTDAGKANTTGQSNSFFGYYAGGSNTTGYYNSLFGCLAGGNNTTGIGNSFFGYGAGHSNHTGNFNVFLGYEAGYYETGSDKLYIDNTDSGHPPIWGDFSTNNIVIYGGFRSIASHMSSDQRLKKNIEPLESSLDKISNLHGVSYEWRTDEYPDIGLTKGRHIGLVAQDVETEIPELVSEDKDGYKAVSYAKLTAVLVEAVKELKAQNDKQQSEIEQLRALIKDLKRL